MSGACILGGECHTVEPQLVINISLAPVLSRVAIYVMMRKGRACPRDANINSALQGTTADDNTIFSFCLIMVTNNTVNARRKSACVPHYRSVRTHISFDFCATVEVQCYLTSTSSAGDNGAIS